MTSFSVTDWVGSKIQILEPTMRILICELADRNWRQNQVVLISVLLLLTWPWPKNILSKIKWNIPWEVELAKFLVQCSKNQNSCEHTLKGCYQLRFVWSIISIMLTSVWTTFGPFSVTWRHVTHVTNLLLLGVNHLMEPIIKLNKRCS